MKESSHSRKVAAKVIFAALSALKANDGELHRTKVLEEIEKRVVFDEWESSYYEKSKQIRWQTIFGFYTIGCVKAGFIIKRAGIWYLTPEGEKSLELGETKLIQEINDQYQKWKLTQQPINDISQTNGFETDHIDEPDVIKTSEMTLDEYKSIASENLKQYIDNLSPYEFQELSAALLRGMGYFTPFVAPKGKAGGIDIIAYRDPLGTASPRMKVQVKHRESAASVQEVRQLMGLLQKDGDVGIFISMGGFTTDAKQTARSSHVHVELIDFERFISLWQDFYEKMPDEDKNKLPLVPIYFLGK